jgi:hypothetical protein
MSNTITATISLALLKWMGLEIFYHEAGPGHAPTLLLLQSFPPSSHINEKLDFPSYAMYLLDIDAPAGFQLAVMRPKRVTALIAKMETPILKPSIRSSQRSY